MSIIIALIIAGLLCWLASAILPAGAPLYIAYVVIVLACLGGFIGFGGIAGPHHTALP